MKGKVKGVERVTLTLRSAGMNVGSCRKRFVLENFHESLVANVEKILLWMEQLLIVLEAGVMIALENLR